MFSVIGVDDRVGLDLDHGVVIDESGNFDQGQRGADLAELLTVKFADFPPFRDIRHENPRADDIGGLAAEGLDRGDDDPERPPGLSLHRRGVAAIRFDADRPGDGDEIASADGARIADRRFPR